MSIAVAHEHLRVQLVLMSRVICPLYILLICQGSDMFFLCSTLLLLKLCVFDFFGQKHNKKMFGTKLRCTLVPKTYMVGSKKL